MKDETQEKDYQFRRSVFRQWTYSRPHPNKAKYGYAMELRNKVKIISISERYTRTSPTNKGITLVPLMVSHGSPILIES